MEEKLLTEQILNNVSLNEYEFVNGKNLKEALRGVYHDAEEKVMVATNGCVMYVSKKLYNEECAGRIVDEDGDLLSESLKFPRWNVVVPRPEFFDLYEVDMENLAKAVKEMLFPATMTNQPCSILIHGQLIRVEFAEKMLRFMLLNGTNQILLDKWYGSNRPVMVRTEDEFLMIMPAVLRTDEPYVEVECKKVNE